MGHQKLRAKKIKNYNQYKQFDFVRPNWQFRYNHGGTLRNKRRGRTARPLSTRAPIHLVFKADIKNLRRGLRSPLGFAITNQTIKKYAQRFFVKVEQVSINNDHIHLLVRFSKRTHAQSFLRTVSGQIAQQFQKNGFVVTACKSENSRDPKVRVTDTLIHQKYPGQKANTRGGRRRISKIKMWKYRPFTRVIQGWKPYQIVRNYIQLNIKEAAGVIRYRKDRLKGLSSGEWEMLWV